MWTISTSKHSPPEPSRQRARTGWGAGVDGLATTISVRVVAWLALGVTACTHGDAASGAAATVTARTSPPAATSTPAETASRARVTASDSAVAAGPSAPAAFCAGLARANDAALGAVPADHPVAVAWRKAAVCEASARAAWGVALESIRATPADASEIVGRWSLRHLRLFPDGSSREDAPLAPDSLSATPALPVDGESLAAPDRPNLSWSDYERVLPAAPAFHDFDGDGEPEAVVVVETIDIAESGLQHPTRRGRVWTAPAGSTGIELYGPARELVVEDVRDVDGDGRPDLVTRGPYVGSVTITCGSQDSYPVTGPALLAHALPGGTFASADAAATDFARRDCPKSPRPVMVRLPGGIGPPGGIAFATTARNVACARLWGAATSTVAASIATACRQPAGAACQPCDDAALLDAWAHVPPPLLLAPPARTLRK